MRSLLASLWRVLPVLPVIFLPACAMAPVARAQAVRMNLAAMRWTAADGCEFPFKAWVPENRPPKAVVIGVHGLSGAVQDHTELGKSLQRRGIAYYGYELRGQGNDPVKERIGDIKEAKDWHDDLRDFHRLVVIRHPGVPIVWMGESLGALIVCGTVSAAWPVDVAAPSALVLVSPIPEFDHRVGILRRQALAIAAMAKPMMKRPLASFSTTGDKGWQMTSTSNHIEQSAHTAWAVPEYTVRFYHVLSVMVGRMMSMAREIEQPVFVIRAGHDVFASEASVRKFTAKLKDAELAVYGNSHHLLFYDVDRDNVVRDITRWVDSNSGEKR